MARDHGQIKWAIWNDREFKALAREDQWVFMLALTQPSLSFAGVLPYTLRRWQQLAADCSVQVLEDSVKRLEAARFLVVDPDSEEMLIRGFIRNDGLLGSPNITRSMVRDFGTICSPLLRAVIVCEIARMLRETPRVGNDKTWSEVLEPWLGETLPAMVGDGTFPGPFAEALSQGQLEVLEAVSRHGMSAAITLASPPARAAPRRAADGSVRLGYCEVHHQNEPCNGCAADRKAAPG